MARTFFNKTNIAINQGFVPSFKVELFGQWERTIKTIQRLEPILKESGIRAQLKVGKAICEKVKWHIHNQDLPWAPLSEKYIKQKEQAGLYSDIMIAHGVYYNNIKVWTVSNNHLVMIGVKRGIYTSSASTGKKSRLDVSQIAAIHEFSTGSRVPRRPLWNPTIAEFGGVKGIQNLFIKHFTGYLRVRGIPFKEYKKIF